MISLADLWLPILLSAVFVFVVSSIIHMALTYHKNDFQKLPNEDQILEAIRARQVQPGAYMFPAAPSMKAMGSPEMLEKYNRGPVGHMTVLPNGPCNIGKSLAQWFALSLAIGAFSGYAASIGLTSAASGMDVFRLTFVPAVLGYAVSGVENSIWKGARWSLTGKYIFDGVLYALVTAATFAWLWPTMALEIP